MITKHKSKRSRIRTRVRSKISGTAERPRLSVYKSSKHIYAQLIDDTSATTLAHTTSNSSALAKETDGKNKLEKAHAVGKAIAALAADKKITACVFDRSGFKYHGIVKEIAEGAREGGLKF